MLKLLKGWAILTQGKNDTSKVNILSTTQVKYLTIKSNFELSKTYVLKYFHANELYVRYVTHKLDYLVLRNMT